MPKFVYYAMDEAYLTEYADLKTRISEGSLSLSDERIKAITAKMQKTRDDSRPLYTVDDDGTAHIVIAGPLEPKPDLCAMAFDLDMTTYRDIIEGTRAANADKTVESLLYHFDTPGGNVVGLFAAADEIRNSEKPTRGIVHSLCASAGIVLLSQCNIIDAENIASESGSVGVVTERVDISKQDAARGVVRHTIVSENAPDKRPDVTTEEGRAKIKARLTELESVMIDYIATGRGTTAAAVKENFGQGAILIAKKALSAGMIDSILSDITAGEPVKTDGRETTAASEETQGVNQMEITQEQLDKIASDAATKAAAAAVSGIDAKLDARDAAQKAENERLSAFADLKTLYPNQSAMIDEESKKEGATASIAFVKKCADAETARLAAAGEQESASEEQAETEAPATSAGAETDPVSAALDKAYGAKGAK